MRPVIQRKTVPCTRSSVASSATKPSAMRQYRLRYHTCSGIGELVPGPPDGEDVLRIARVGFDLLPQPLDHGIHAAFRDVRLLRPHALEQHLAREHDAGMPGEEIQH